MTIDITRFPALEPIAYEEARPHIRTGDLLLCSGESLGGAVIRVLTKSAFGHIGLIAKITVAGEERLVVLESIIGVGVRMVQLSNYVRNHSGRGRGYRGKLLVARDARFDVEAHGNTFVNHGFVRQGYQYDHAALLRIMTRMIMARFGIILTALDRDNEYICSELAEEMFETVGITYQEDPRGFIAPQHFARDEHVFPVAMLRTE